jgi:Family of unknown function (DUF6152)
MCRLACAVGVITALAVPAAWAHHSAAAEYSSSKLLVLKGTITKVEWRNPHVYCHLEVKNPGVATTDWYLEMASPNGMQRQGWTANTMKPGDVVTVEAFAAKDHPTLAKVHRIKVADGRWMNVDAAASTS